MAIPLVINGISFNYPQIGDVNWGSQATNWSSAVTVGMLQRAGGAFTLIADVDFGANFGLLSAYFSSRNTSASHTGEIRLGNTETLSWRNAGDSNDLALTANSSNQLEFNGSVVRTGLIVNADIDAAAAIAFSKMAALTVSRALVSDASGVVTVSAATSTEVGYLSGVSSALQTQLDAKIALAGGTMTGNLFLNGDPSLSTQAATKAYVDSLVSGLQPKSSCRAATTANLSIATDLENGDSLDGLTLATGDRVLVKNQSTASQNGIYVVPASGAASRAIDMDTWSETLQAYTFVSEGTVNAATGWVSQSTAGGTIGVTSLPFAQFLANTAYTADGQGIELSGSQFSLELDGSTLSKSATGVKVATGGLTNTQVNASAAIALTKLAATTANRAIVSDGSGFLSAATTTATQIGYLSDVTGLIQNQLNGKISASLLTTNGDMIYRSAGVPARLPIAVGDNSILRSNGIPEWFDPGQTYTAIRSTASSYTIQTTFTALTLSTPYQVEGGGVSDVVGNILTDWAYTGTYEMSIECSNIVNSAGTRDIMVRLYNTTTSSAADYSITDQRGTSNNSGSSHFTLVFDIVNGHQSDNYEVQIASSGSGCVITQATVGGQASALYKIMCRHLWHAIVE